MQCMPEDANAETNEEEEEAEQEGSGLPGQMLELLAATVQLEHPRRPKRTRHARIA